MTGFFPIAVGIVAFAALLIFDVHAIAIIAVSAAAGLIRYRLLPWKG
jgi:hypothetical protein